MLCELLACEKTLLPKNGVYQKGPFSHARHRDRCFTDENFSSDLIYDHFSDKERKKRKGKKGAIFEHIAYAQNKKD